MENIIGNDRVKSYLQSMIRTGANRGSLLFAGPSGVGKSLFAYAFAKEVICSTDLKGNHEHKIDSGNHPDIHVYRPVGKVGMHSIDSIRDLIAESYLHPNEAKRKIFIIHDADRMLTSSANALLKTFEEPPEDTLIILVSSSPESIIDTILSRCKKISFGSISREKIELFLQDKFSKNKEESSNLASLAMGSIGRACSLVNRGSDNKRTILLDLLANFKDMNYTQVMTHVDEICALVDLDKKEWQEEAESLFENFDKDSITAKQRQEFEKEKDGFVSMRYAQEADVLLETIALWYRDLLLLQFGNNEKLVVNCDYLHKLKNISTPLPNAEHLQDALIDAKTSISRSTPLKTCLESFFLHLSPSFV